MIIHELVEKSNNNFSLFKKGISMLKSCAKRLVLASFSEAYGYGGDSFVAREFHIGRDTIRKGRNELRTGIRCEDAFNMRGRKKVEESLSNLLTDIKCIADGQSQTDPTFKSTRLYTRLSVSEFRKQLIKQKEYTDAELPTNQTINTKINELGYTTKKIQKTKPLKKPIETDAIFENLQKMHKKIETDNDIIRLSIDAKDRVKIGEFSRGGRSRITKKANDHDFGKEYVTPFGIMNVKDGTVEISIAESKVTADYIVDRIEEYWDKHSFNNAGKTLFLNADNGPENNSRRTQFIKRMVDFSAKSNTKIILAYYPPYHSKYNPVERVWGILEQHWNGDIMDSKNTVVEFAKSMTYKGQKPEVTLIDKIYETGKKLNKKIMAIYESALERKEGIEKWFISITPSKAKTIACLKI